MSEGGRTRTRRPNFTREEIDTLLSSMEKAKPILFGPKLTPSALNNEVRSQTWMEITNAVNVASQGEMHRGPQDVQKKWSDMCTLTRKKVNDPDNKQLHGPLNNWDRRVIKLLGLTAPAVKDGETHDLGGKMEVEDPNFEDNIFAVMEEEDDLGSSSSHDLGNLATPGIPTVGDATDISGDGSSTGNTLCLENGSFSKQSEPTKRKRIIRNSDIIMAVKRKKLRLMEEKNQLQRDRLEIEKQILETLKDIKSVQAPPGF